MKRSLNEIKAVSTSHDVGQKRVLLAANESGCSLTQIAVTDLKAGEVAQAHIHPDMQEGFYVLEGNLDVKLADKTLHCTKDDFVYVKSLTSHELLAVTDVRIMTIGCVIESQQSKLYPVLFKPNLHEIVWGGNKLTAWKGLIDGLDSIEEDLKTNTSLHKKLVKLQQNGGLEKLDDTRIKKMAKVCKRYGERIAVGADGHIKISDRKDFETVIKAMCDYYKKGEVSGKSYGTFSGRELKEVGE